MTNTTRSRAALGAVLATLALTTTLLATASAASGPAPGLDDDWTRGTHTLLSFVPAEFRAACLVREADADPSIDQAVLDDRTGALRCDVPDTDITVTYKQFASADSADAYVDALTGGPESRDQADTAADCPTQFRIERGKDDVGRYLCFLANDDSELADGTPIITWTFEPRAIVAQAWDTGSDLAKLRKFWSDDAGPLSEADRRGIPPLATQAQLRAAGKQLRADVPEASRKHCQIIDAFTPDGLGGEFDRRLWITADVEECRPTRGSTDSEYFRLATEPAMDAFIAPGLAADLDDEGRSSGGGIDCAGAGSYKVDGKVAGQYLCYFSDEDTDAHDSTTEFVHLVFSVAKQKIVGTGGAPSKQTKALLQWWEDDARP